MEQDAPSRDLSRRSFLGVIGASGLAAFGGSLFTQGPALAAPTVDGLTPLRHAMHVHTSFSEGRASLHSQLEEATRNGFDVFWPSDHDWRMSAYDAPTTFHFTDLTELVAGNDFTWTSETDGPSMFSAGRVVDTRPSPLDLAELKGALKVEVRSSGSEPASHRFLMDGRAANNSHRTNLAGQTLVIDVLPDLVGPDAWAEVLVTMSYRPATGGRPAGDYEISYRIGRAAPGRRTEGLLGIVNLRRPAGEFGTVTLDPVADAAVLWPDVVATDNALRDLRLGVTSRDQSPARAYFSHLRFDRTGIDGDAPLRTQEAMVKQYAGQYPDLTIGHGIEVSGAAEHANWFGGVQHLIDHGTTDPDDLVAYATDVIHRRGGLASLNHPYGTSEIEVLPVAEQGLKRALTAQKFLDRELCGVDLVETGYRLRAGMPLEAHLALYDAFVRSGYWVTAISAIDNHDGLAGSWAEEANRFYTTTWAASSSEEDLLAALRSGRAFVGELGSFDGHLDLSVEGNPMGSVSIKPGARTRALSIAATGLPKGSSVEVVRGPVDYANGGEAGTSVVRTLPETAFGSGKAVVGIDVRTSCFVRVNVIDTEGTCIAFSNPVVLLQSEPERTLTAWRRAPDS